MSWELFTGDGVPHRNRDKSNEEAWNRIPPPPPWRLRAAGKAPVFVMPAGLARAVNASLHLRRPLLISGPPGSGKSTLAYLIAEELELGAVLKWHITSRSTRNEGLWEYDALGRLHATQVARRDADQDANQAAHHGRDAGPADEVRNDDVQNFVTLGALGTALAASQVRIVLIDEIDKSDLDLPGDLLDVMENGEFTIPVLRRADSDREFSVRGADGQQYAIAASGIVKLKPERFPVIVFTSNGERLFSSPFLRRCVRFTMPEANEETLVEIVTAHLNSAAAATGEEQIKKFAENLTGNKKQLAINQILEFVYLITGDYPSDERSRGKLADILLQELNGT
jgi:MoxR-like ATPase